MLSILNFLFQLKNHINFSFWIKYQQQQYFIRMHYLQSNPSYISYNIKRQELDQWILNSKVLEKRAFIEPLGLKYNFNKEIYFSDKAKFNTIFENFYLADKNWRKANQDPFISKEEYYEIADKCFYWTQKYNQVVDNIIAHRIPGGTVPKYNACWIFEQTQIKNRDDLGDIAAIQEIEPLKGLEHCDIPEGLDYDLLIHIFSGLLF